MPPKFYKYNLWRVLILNVKPHRVKPLFLKVMIKAEKRRKFSNSIKKRRPIEIFIASYLRENRYCLGINTFVYKGLFGG